MMSKLTMRWWIVFVAGVVLAGRAAGQLAITEMMSSEATTFTSGGVTNSITAHSDYWELSNFGAVPIDLTGYKMADEGAGLGGAVSTPFDGVTIGPGEVILFVQDSSDTAEQQVRAWWGTNLNPAVRIIFYHNFGLSANGDGMSLWDASDNLVDHAHVDAAVRGVSFTYNPASGAFGILSTNGANGAFAAATSDDVGSPGANAGPVALAFVIQPTNQSVVAGSSVSWVAAAIGLPQPHYQWRFNGTNIAGATDAVFTLTNVGTNDAGHYDVLLTNGVSVLASSNVVLSVNPAPVAPSVISFAQDLAAYVGQAATFTVVAAGQPAPTYQWMFNGSPLPGQTTNTLVVIGLQTNNSGMYSLRISNSAGVTNAPVNLLVTPRPNLVITEVQSSEASGDAANSDWWELANLDSFPVDLYGYRWDDNSANLGVAFTVTNHVIIHPGEVVIFVETSEPGVMTADKFKAWWGETNLPPGLQIIVYQGNGLGLSSGNDQVNFWNQAATLDNDPIGKVAHVDLSSSPAGRTFVRDPDSGIFWGNSTQGMSTNGVNGAFTSINGDVGSPGWIVAPLRLRWVRDELSFGIQWDSVPDRQYSLFSASEATGDAWSLVTTLTASNSITTVQDPAPGATRFYRAGVTVK